MRSLSIKPYISTIDAIQKARLVALSGLTVEQSGFALACRKNRLFNEKHGNFKTAAEWIEVCFLAYVGCYIPRVVILADEQYFNRNFEPCPCPTGLSFEQDALLDAFRLDVTSFDGAQNLYYEIKKDLIKAVFSDRSKMDYFTRSLFTSREPIFKALFNCACLALPQHKKDIEHHRQLSDLKGGQSCVH